MLKKTRPITPGVRHELKVVQLHTTDKPEKSLLRPMKKKSGRNAHGHITTRHRGGGHKRHYRIIDFARNKHNIPAVVKTLEYDPNRSSKIALLQYPDGEKRYILAPKDLRPGATVISGDQAEPKIGNALPLKNIPVGMLIHNIELKQGKGGQIIRGAGTSASIQSKEAGQATIKLPSGEIRLIKDTCFATIGQVSNADHKNRKLGKAGVRRHMGWRPAVRGVAMHPGAHPHGGGEGRSGIGMKSPKSPWGKRTLGKKTRKPKKYSDKVIIKGRRKK